ncbi:hypothetical protein SAMN05421846_10313 [Chryseobacterium taeanense]|uniref:Tetratricopeptide repeat-containing protein n=1 Tax=Chryseobacterium taeanense TaxID=311334 RepID=A0A1G8GKS2_9FLAO|nr:hypothetical protein [Chryseobacterium taeanense]SDH94962.1 hypothetical protein SAMN05421846_10313 [Chryseobacterium taeanense]
MTKILLTLLLCLLAIFSYCQLPENLQKYYASIDKAEYALVMGNKQEASDNYYQAFNEKENPFFDDIYNSFLVNAELQNDERGKQDYKKLKCLQYNFSEIKAFVFFEKFQERNKSFIEQIICTKNYFNYKLRKTLDSLAQWDQMYRSTGSVQNLNAEERKIFIKNDSINAFTLKKIIEKYGFPNEYLIGMDNSSLYANFKYQAIIIHQQKMGKYKHVDFEPLLYKAVQEGKMRNKDYAALVEFAFVKKEYNYFPLIMLNDGCCLINKSIYPEYRDQQKKQEIQNAEKRRSEIGLTSLSRNVLYKLYNEENPKYKLEPFYKVTLFLGKEEEENLRKKSIKINFEDYFKQYHDKNYNGK